jgi:hypothetical protein
MNTQLSLIKIDGLKVTTTGIEKFPKNFSFENGILGLKQLARGDSFLRWIIGDLLNYLMPKFCPRDPASGQFKSKEQSERAKLIFDVTGLAVGTLNNCSTVAFAFTISRRRETVSWSHHAELCGLSQQEQDKWLDRCERDRLSTRDLRVVIAEQTGEREARQPSLFSEFNPVKTVNELVRGMKLLEEEKPLKNWPLDAVQKMASDLEEPYALLTDFRGRLLARLE